MFKKILISNRGEIAVRIIKAAHELNIRTVAVYARPDKTALHVRLADESYFIGEEDLSDSYLNIKKMIEVALKSGCKAIHPGYGFLAENPEFTKACNKAGLVFIGPSARAIQLMGNKIESRAFVKKLGVPMTLAVTGTIQNILKNVHHIPFPVLVKAAAGGGGKGMRIVKKPGSLEEALKQTSREAKTYFGDGTVYVEQYIQEPRHIEIQILGDHHGKLVHLFERECSIQRRYQKIIEESPSPTLTEEVRRKMGEAAVKIAKAVDYTNAGTIEFMVDKNLNFYFLEMNTRIQVEHPVTEEVTSIDLVKEQIKIAAGEKIGFRQTDLEQMGHSIECRIYAEDPGKDFIPSPGRITLYHEPEGPGIRVDSGFDNPAKVESFYDPMICKLIATGKNRKEAIARMENALLKFTLHGIHTNIPYLAILIRHQDFLENHLSTKFCELHTPMIIKELSERRKNIPALRPVCAAFISEFKQDNHKVKNSVWQQIGYWRDLSAITVLLDEEELSFSMKFDGKDSFTFENKTLHSKVKFLALQGGNLDLEFDGTTEQFTVSTEREDTCTVGYQGFNFRIIRIDRLPTQPVQSSQRALKPENGQAPILAPMPGSIIMIPVQKGEKVHKGTVLAIVEAMKMENQIKAPFESTVDAIHVKKGDKVDGGEILLILKIKD